MSDNMWIVILVLALAAIGACAWMMVSRRRTGKLRSQFGPEYDRVVRETGSRRSAESELAERRERVQQLHLHPLSPAQHDRFLERWRLIQASFVDDPSAATGQADQLIREVMSVRGYPLGDFQQRSADISVDHPIVVQRYRSAREIAQRNERGEATTEDLRNAFVYYRDLFEELLEVGAVERVEEVHRKSA